MELLERDRELAVVATALREARGAGRVVIVVGEAGIGKTALLRSAVSGSGRVLWGGCDPLVTPRPLGPLRDAAREAGGPLAAAVKGSREDLLAAVLDELELGTPLVVDDLHWADDATLDLVALLGRRLARSPGCLLLACRATRSASGPRCAACWRRFHASARGAWSRARCPPRPSPRWRGRRGARPPTGLRNIPRGPRAATRANLAGLTPRQAEVLDLIVSGATNAEIAEALVITPKTVDHHVSAVLAKLGVASRRDAGAAAERIAAAD